MADISSVATSNDSKLTSHFWALCRFSRELGGMVGNMGLYWGYIGIMEKKLENIGILGYI